MITKKVRQAAEKYGRVGVLVDGGEAAEIHLAVELYSSEVLPRWWVRCGCIKDGEAAIKEVMKIGSDDPSTRVPPVLLVVERFLPVAARGRPMDWSEASTNNAGGDDDSCAAFRNCLQKLRERRDTVVVCVTSRPQAYRGSGNTPANGAGGADSFDFIHRTEHPVRTKLDELEATNCWVQGLKVFCSARVHSSLKEVRGDLQNSGCMCILLTGVGMSRSSSAPPTVAPSIGMPESAQLMLEVANATWEAAETQGKLRQRLKGYHEHHSSYVASGESEPPLLALIRLGKERLETIEEAKQKDEKLVKTLKGDFNVLFPMRNELLRKYKKGNRLNVEPILYAFEATFREVFGRYDHGITRQHIEAARLDYALEADGSEENWENRGCFDLIVTTNWDQFHERSAMEAARSCFSRLPLALPIEGTDQIRPPAETVCQGCGAEIRSTSSLTPRPQSGTSSESDRTPTEPGRGQTDEQGSSVHARLFKLYGSLGSGSPLALYSDDFKTEPIVETIMNLRKSRSSLLLTVVGHSLSEQWLPKALNKLLYGPDERGFEEVRIVWVEYDEERGWMTKPVQGTGWEAVLGVEKAQLGHAAAAAPVVDRTMREAWAKEGAKTVGTLYHVSALEFFYDLNRPWSGRWD